jgi:hypothetical protein
VELTRRKPAPLPVVSWGDLYILCIASILTGVRLSFPCTRHDPVRHSSSSWPRISVRQYAAHMGSTEPPFSELTQRIGRRSSSRRRRDVVSLFCVLDECSCLDEALPLMGDITDPMLMRNGVRIARMAKKLEARWYFTSPSVGRTFRYGHIT